MRNYLISSKKASFPAIWAGLTGLQQEDLRVKLVVKVRVKDNTLYRWYKGLCFPTDYSTRRDVAEVVSDFMGRTLTPDELFPDK